MYYSGLLLFFSLAKDAWICCVDMRSRRLLSLQTYSVSLSCILYSVVSSL
ncbi:hypothetical protein RchiOBHm_Chr2g0112571 [Rosa chinensis]|uniref:Uncharacterized protein n=1 Tax=Rosa chinensis TaxID=74649 RepID=A0A2P6QY63_ROSCH|nr:hypothetical protein RchiOBHm_Chr4g0421751 [Rosa chinensis]PRQ48602.1 hypothetical protein RchiOBHm_Chr2g0112571 [Rosa chinensis]